MRNNILKSYLRRGGLTVLVGAAAILLAPNSRVLSEELDVAEPVIRVEEDWKLILNEPDDGVDSPQFHTVMSPYGDVDSTYAQVLWNYRETPDYREGGVQLQCYDGDYLLRRRSIEYGQLSTRAEAITWTQALETTGLEIIFEVFNGSSDTWGSFGHDMRISSEVSVAGLSNYDPKVSQENSCITYGSNRVDKLVITEVRYYGEDGLIAVESAERVVFDIEDQE